MNRTLTSLMTKFTDVFLELIFLAVVLSKMILFLESVMKSKLLNELNPNRGKVTSAITKVY